MKHILFILILATAILSYFVIDMKFINPPDSSPVNKNIPMSAKATNIPKSSPSELQNEVVQLKDALSNQSVFIQKLNEDRLSDSAKILELEKQLQIAMAIIQSRFLDNKSLAGVTGSSETKIDATDKMGLLSNPILTPILSGEIFKDPQFAKVFQKQVTEAVKTMQQKERKDQEEQAKEQMQQRLARRIDEFAKSANLNNYQQQEITKILSEGSNNSMDLLSRLRDQKISGEELRAKQESIRKESDEKIKLVLSSQQFEQYQKVESSILRGIMSGRQFGGPPSRNANPAPQTAPQTTPSPNR